MSPRILVPVASVGLTTLGASWSHALFVAQGDGTFADLRRGDVETLFWSSIALGTLVLGAFGLAYGLASLRRNGIDVP